MSSRYAEAGGQQSVLPSPFTLTEKRFQQQVVQYAELMGWRIRHDSATNQRRTCRRCSAPLRCAACGDDITVVRNRAGMPDLLLIRRPRVVWAELKSERGKLTDDQRAMLEQLRGCDQEAYVWRPSSWPAIEKVLR